MVRNVVALIAIIFLLSSCSSLKPLNFTSNKQVMTASAPDEIRATNTNDKKNSVKFIEDIAVTPEPTATAESKNSKATANEKSTVRTRGFSIDETKPVSTTSTENTSNIEKASALRLKYSVLLNTEVEELKNEVLLESLDEWYGTRYRLGGMTKSGVDCSAFVQAVFATTFGISLPRTAREQHRVAQKISRTELKEGDLLFFNTRGGVSHVGIYLQNNKFIHASTSRGVTISDMFEPYYLKRFIGAGRIDTRQEGLSSSN